MTTVCIEQPVVQINKLSVLKFIFSKECAILGLSWNTLKKILTKKIRGNLAHTLVTNTGNSRNFWLALTSSHEKNSGRSLLRHPKVESGVTSELPQISWGKLQAKDCRSPDGDYSLPCSSLTAFCWWNTLWNSAKERATTFASSCSTCFFRVSLLVFVHWSPSFLSDWKPSTEVAYAGCGLSGCFTRALPWLRWLIG